MGVLTTQHSFVVKIVESTMKIMESLTFLLGTNKSFFVNYFINSKYKELMVPREFKSLMEINNSKSHHEPACCTQGDCEV